MWAFYTLERIGCDKPLLFGPRKAAMRNPSSVSLRCFVPVLGIDPFGNVVGLWLGDKPYPTRLGELLAVEPVVAVGIGGKACLGKAKERLDDIGNPSRGCIRRLMPGEDQLVKFFLGLRATRSP